MILIDDFFTVKSQDVSDGKANFRIKLNAKHFVYQAHFPNTPITPGACLLQMTTEIFSSLKAANFRIKVLKNVKFIAPINPLEFSETDFLIEFSENETDWQLKILIKENETVFAKMSMVLSTNYTN